MKAIYRRLPRKFRRLLRKALPFMVNDTRSKLLHMLPANSVGLEIGVHKGDFTARILQIVKPSMLIIIDPWQHFDDEVYATAHYGGRAGSQQSMDERYQAVLDRFSDQIANGIVHIYRDYSQNIASQFEDHFFDWVYVDGNHLYDGVLADLRAYQPKIKPGGFLCGDDYQSKGWWNDGVTQAVDQFTTEQGFQKTIIGYQFLIRL